METAAIASKAPASNWNTSGMTGFSAGSFATAAVGNRCPRSLGFPSNQAPPIGSLRHQNASPQNPATSSSASIRPLADAVTNHRFVSPSQPKLARSSSNDRVRLLLKKLVVSPKTSTRPCPWRSPATSTKSPKRSVA